MCSDETDDFQQLLNAAGAGHLQHQHAAELAIFLRKFDRAKAITAVAALLTTPKLQANVYRLELLAHLVAASCQGIDSVKVSDLECCLNDYLGRPPIVWMEDPPEDVFVSNVITRHGDFLVLSGMWEVGDQAATALIRTIERQGGHEQQAWLHSTYALLRLSDALLRNSGLARWDSAPSEPKGHVALGRASEIAARSRNATFLKADLSALDVSMEQLAPFIMSDDECAALLLQSNQASIFHLKPLIRVGNRLLLALPTSVTSAIRYHILRSAAQAEQLNPLSDFLIRDVTNRASRLLKRGSRHGARSIALPKELAEVDGLSTNLLLQLGLRQFIHVLILIDPLTDFENAGLSHAIELSDVEEDTVFESLKAVREYAETNYEVDGAHTLFIFGHLGQSLRLSEPPPSREMDLRTVPYTRP